MSPYYPPAATSTGPGIKPARVVSTSNVSIASAPATIDSVTLVSGDRVFLPSQTTQADRGIYTFNGTGSAMTRTSDADTSEDWPVGTHIFVSEGGTNNGDSLWIMGNNTPPTIGSTSLFFSRIANAYTASRQEANAWSGEQSYGELYMSGAGRMNDTARTSGATFPDTGDIIQESNLSAPGTHTLPASPTDGRIFIVKDVAKNAATHNITIARNGKTIDGAAADYVLNTNGVCAWFRYDSTAGDWRVLMKFAG